MSHQLIEGFILLVIGSALTFGARWLYDRRSAKGGKMTFEKCKDNQALCFLKVTNKIMEVTAKISELNMQLVCGDENFEQITTFQDKTSYTMKLILMTLSELCEVGDGCKTETKEDLRREILK